MDPIIITLQQGQEAPRGQIVYKMVELGFRLRRFRPVLFTGLSYGPLRPLRTACPLKGGGAGPSGVSQGAGGWCYGAQGQGVAAAGVGGQ